jgi:hypothetical protein
MSIASRRQRSKPGPMRWSFIEARRPGLARKRSPRSSVRTGSNAARSGRDLRQHVLHRPRAKANATGRPSPPRPASGPAGAPAHHRFWRIGRRLRELGGITREHRAGLYGGTVDGANRLARLSHPTNGRGRGDTDRRERYLDRRVCTGVERALGFTRCRLRPRGVRRNSAAINPVLTDGNRSGLPKTKAGPMRHAGCSGSNP